MDFQAKYGNEIGSCASCAFVRSVNPNNPADEHMPWDGSRHAVCGKEGNTSNIVFRDKPDMNLPTNECWTPKHKTGPEGEGLCLQT